MKTNWKRNAAAIIVSAAVLVAVQPFPAFADGGAAIVLEAGYALTDSIRAEVKSVVYERTADGSRIATVIRLSNHGARIVRIPDYELRVKAEDGTEYTLSPSVTNAKAIQPKETVELGYMAQVDTAEEIKVAELSWVEMDEYVYPKLETEKLTIPVSSLVWHGQHFAAGGWRKWGTAFPFPAVPSLVIKASQITDQAATDGPVVLAALDVTNQGQLEITVPDFRLDGRTEEKVSKGSRIGKDPVVLGPGETKRLYFAIPKDTDEVFQGLLLLTEEAYVGENSKPVPYSVGWLELAPPGEADPKDAINSLPAYTLGQPFGFDPVNTLIPQQVSVSLEELHLLESREDGYKAYNAKFKLQNNLDYPVPLPNFQAEIVNAEGSSYTGDRTGRIAETLLPHLSYIVDYTFVVPDTETGGLLELKLSDHTTLAPYAIPIAAYRTQVQDDGADGIITVYPYELSFKKWDLDSKVEWNDGHFARTYEVTLDVGLERKEKVLYDYSLSRIKVELVDSDGEVLGVRYLPFKGDQRLKPGEQTIVFKGIEQDASGLTLNIYETVTTPFGEADRLVKTLKE